MPRRLLPQRPLPEHAPYRPGYGTRPEEAGPQLWSTQDLFAGGVDLFHADYFWEAHEAWEHVWHVAEDGSPFESLVRALIRTTAAHVKRRDGSERGVASHRRGAQRHLDGLCETLDFGPWNIDVAALRELLLRDELPRVLPIKRA
ncbi:MAG: DUF309 domain-containing protein [Nannocystales bacterium]